MKYLVLGSSGQIGVPLTNYIRRMGHEALEFDLVNGPEQDLRIPNNPLLIQYMEQADFVFFLAFDVGGSRYLKTYQHSWEFVDNNVKLMDNTFSLLKKTKKPFLFASSQMSNMTYSPYGQLKALGELYARVLNSLVIRFWNVYGVEHDFEKSHVITDFILAARQHQAIPMLTDGSELRQFLYADDCSECLLNLAERYAEIPRTQELHVTNFKWNSVMDVAKVVADLYPGTEIKPAALKDDIQKDKRNEPDPFILNYWSPKTELAEGIRLVDSLML